MADNSARLNRQGAIRLHHNTRAPLREGEYTPIVSRDLLEYLDKMFPNSLPPEGSPYSDLEKKWGQRRVVNHLHDLFKQQEEEQPNVLQHENADHAFDSGSASAPSG